MRGSSRGFRMALAVVALLQSGAVASMVYERHRLVQSGREIILPVRPVDPRDIFRGDYVTLSYDISRLTNETASPERIPAGLSKGDDVFATLTPSGDGTWTLKTLTPSFPTAVASGDVVIKGHVQSLWRGPEQEATLNVRYGIEQYFIPEGTGSELEAKVRDKKIAAIVAVAPSGEAALKGLVIDGERRADPSLF
jgi:uncharacterized membrane-anchored protein